MPAITCKSALSDPQDPEDLEMMIGSQWWCLRRLTIEKVLDFCKHRPEVPRFFATTWIPDETFFPDRRAPCRPPVRDPLAHADLSDLLIATDSKPVQFDSVRIVRTGTNLVTQRHSL